MIFANSKIFISETDKQMTSANAPAWMSQSLADTCGHWEVARQSLVKMWMAERMSRREGY